MKRTIIAVLGIVFMVFTFASCRPATVVVPIPDPDTPTVNPNPNPTPEVPKVSFVDNGIEKTLSWNYFDGSTWGDGASSIEVVDGGLKLATGQAIYIGRESTSVDTLTLEDGDIYTISYSVDKSNLKTGYFIGLAINDENNAFVKGQWMIPVTGNTVNVEITKSNGSITNTAGDASISAAGAIAQVVGGTTNFDEETDGYVVLSDLSIKKEKIEEPSVEFTNNDGTTTELSWNYFDGSTWDNSESSIEVVDNGLKFATGQAIYIGRGATGVDSLVLEDGDIYTISYSVDKSNLKAGANYYIGLAINDVSNAFVTGKWMIPVEDDSATATIIKTGDTVTISAEGESISGKGNIAQIVGGTSNFNEEQDGYVIISDLSVKKDSLTGTDDEGSIIVSDDFTADTSALYDPRNVNASATYNPENFVINTEEGVAEVYGGASYFTFPDKDDVLDTSTYDYTVSISGSIPSSFAPANMTADYFGFSVSANQNKPAGGAFFHKDNDALKLSDRENTEGVGVSVKPGDNFEINVTFSESAGTISAIVSASINGGNPATWNGTSSNSLSGVYMSIYGAYTSQAKGNLFMTLDNVSFTRSEKN